MNFFQPIAALLGAALIFSTALAQEGEGKPDKIASVNMQRLVSSFYKTKLTRRFLQAIRRSPQGCR